MTLLSTFDFEGQTAGANVAASSPWQMSSSSGVMTIASAAAVHGTVGGRINNTASYRAVGYVEAAGTATRVIDAYITPRAIPANAYVMALMDGTTSRGDVRINTNGTVSIRNGVSAVATSTAVLDMNTPYRFAWRTSTSGQELRVYAGETSVPLFTLTGALTSNSHTTLFAGLTAASSGTALDVDTIRIADDWLTPVAPSTPLATPTGFTFVASSGVVSITAEWGAVAGAATYDLQVEEYVDGAWELLNTFSGSATSRTLTTAQGLVEGGAYRGRVRAVPAA